MGTFGWGMLVSFILETVLVVLLCKACYEKYYKPLTIKVAEKEISIENIVATKNKQITKYQEQIELLYQKIDNLLYNRPEYVNIGCLYHVDVDEKTGEHMCMAFGMHKIVTDCPRDSATCEHYICEVGNAICRGCDKTISRKEYMTSLQRPEYKGLCAKCRMGDSDNSEES